MKNYTHPHIAVTVNDIDETKQFYTDLGFKILEDIYSKEKQRQFFLLSGYNLEIEVFHFDMQNKDQLIDETDLQKVGIKHVALPVPDLDEVRDLIQTKNIPLTKDINLSSLGIRNLNVTDPSGLILEFFENNI